MTMTYRPWCDPGCDPGSDLRPGEKQQQWKHWEYGLETESPHYIGFSNCTWQWKRMRKLEGDQCLKGLGHVSLPLTPEQHSKYWKHRERREKKLWQKVTLGNLSQGEHTMVPWAKSSLPGIFL